MADFPRRTFKEFVFLHIQEEALLDILVEGAYDEAVVLNFLRESGVTNVAVKPIDTIEVDDRELLRRGRLDNNRERVILAAELFSELFATPGKVLCIVDADLGRQLGNMILCRDLCYTDCSCMEAYAWKDECISRLLTVYCNQPAVDVGLAKDAMRESLLMMFALRLAAARMGFQLDWIENMKSVEYVDGVVKLDVPGFANKLLNKIAQGEMFGEYMQEVESVRCDFDSPSSELIHGHDFIRVLVFLLRSIGVKFVSLDEVTIGRVLALCVVQSELGNEQLFKRIAEFSR